MTCVFLPDFVLYKVILKRPRALGRFKNNTAGESSAGPHCRALISCLKTFSLKLIHFENTTHFINNPSFILSLMQSKLIVPVLVIVLAAWHVLGGLAGARGLVEGHGLGGRRN